MNIFTCTARIGNDAEVRHLQSGTAICTFNGAVDAGYGDRKTTVWCRFSIFGKRAEGGLPQYLVKGQQVAVSGELSLNVWTNNDGVEKTNVEVNVNTIDLVGGKKPAQQQPQRTNQPPQQQEMYPDDVGEELPF